MDVTCSTSSIFNLVAISIDRYIAVTQPIKYAKHRNSHRVWLTIALVWVISAAIGSPIVLGLNNTPDRTPDQCLFYNSDFIIYSSLSSFYIPCIIMVFLYYNIFKALRNRARKAKAARRPLPSDIKPGSVIENIAQTRRLAETALGPSMGPPSSGGGSVGGGGGGGGGGGVEDERPTNTGSGSQEEDDYKDVSPGSEDCCHVIPNDRSTEFILATVAEEAATGVLTGTVPGTGISSAVATAPPDPNGNNDSGYAASNLEESGAVAQVQLQVESPRNKTRRNGSSPGGRQVQQRSAAPPAVVRQPTLDSLLLPPGSGGSKKEKRGASGSASRFTIYKVNKASRKKREKSSAKKERKATKTLAIVLGVFLVCWVPFFTCNILDALCTKMSKDCSPGVTVFLLTTWLGYMNSFVNPVIYTIFNPEFRKAFKKLMALDNT